MAGTRTGILLGAVLLTLAPVSARAQWAVEAFLGTAVSAPSNLTIRQAGEPDISFTAHYATNPFKSSSAPYYGFRVSRWWGRWGAFFDDLHHKLYLTNNPPEVQEFEVTYGYNLFSLGAGYRVGHWSFLAGVGPVVTNPTSTIRGEYKPHGGGIFGGYYFDGAQVQLGAQPPLPCRRALLPVSRCPGIDRVGARRRRQRRRRCAELCDALPSGRGAGKETAGLRSERCGGVPLR